MANIFSGMVNNIGDWFAQKLASYIQDPMGRAYGILTSYYSGDHRAQLAIKQDPKTGKFIDDNIVQNYVGLVVDRSVSRLFQGGVDFELPKSKTGSTDEDSEPKEQSTEQEEYLNRVWDLNKKEIILYQIGLYGAVHGTCYVKIRPDALIDPFTSKLYPKLVPINPRTIRIKTHPEDMNEVQQYVIEYTCKEDRDGRDVDVTHKEVTRRVDMPESTEEREGAVYLVEEAKIMWVVERYEKVGGARMELVDVISWDYDFPPIIHWKNLPSLETCYGDSEIDDVINVQDKNNFVVSNTGKIIKFHAHPNTVGTGFSAKSAEPLDISVDKSFTVIPNPEAKVYNLEMQSDLASSREFAKDLKQSIFDVSREVDVSSLNDRLGALTNFAVRVLYSDALQKNDTKRQLYGDALLELNRRLLVLNNWTGEASNPGTIAWGDPLPSNIKEEMEADKMAIDMGIIDKETVFKRYEDRYGVEWETVQANKEKEKPEPSDQSIDPNMIVANMPRKEMQNETVPNMQRNG